jgi:hypothetical protein
VDEEYEVWSAYLRSTFSPAETVVLKQWMIERKPWDEEHLGLFSVQMAQAIRDFGRDDGSSAKLEDRFEVQSRIVFLSEQEYSELKFEDLAGRYPGASRTIQISRVGFSEDGNLAYFEVEIHRGWNRCSGGSVFMEKKEGSWVETTGPLRRDIIC